MSELSTLKVFAATYVSESELSVKDKLWLIDFIKEGEYNDVIDILEGEYQLPQISDYLAEKVMRIVKQIVKKGMRGGAPPIPKKVGKPLKIRKNLGTSEYIGARQKRKAAEKGFRDLMPSASKENVKAAKHAAKPYRSDERKALGKAVLKVGSAGGAIGLAAAGGHQGYQKYMSKAAVACKNKPNQQACMTAYRQKAQKSKNIYKIKRLRVSKNDCINTGNPVRCRQRIDSKIKQLKEEVFYEGIMGPLGRAFDVLFIFELGSMTYKRFFSGASKACKGSPDRKMCMIRFKIKAKQAQMKTISSKSGLCRKDPNPAKCKNKIMKKLQSLRSDVTMLKQEIV